MKKMPPLTHGDVHEEGDNFVIMGRKIPKPKVGEYVIVWEKEDSSKKHLAQVTQVGKKKMLVTHEHLRYLDGYDVTDKEYPYFHLLYNLGNVDPVTNTLYGENAVLWIETMETSMGKIHFFRSMEKRMKRKLLEGIERIYEQAIQRRWDIFPLEIEVRPPRGKWAGFYVTYKQVKDKPNRLDGLVLHPQEWDPKLIDYILWHELVHGLQWNVLRSQEVAAWIKAYHRSITLSTVTEKELQEVLKDFVHAGTEYEPANDRHQDIFDEATDYLENYHKLEWKDQLLLMEVGKPELIIENWPKTGQLSDQAPEVSEYGTKNWREFMAEAVSFYLSGIEKLPPNIEKLVEKTLRAIADRTAPLKPVDPPKWLKKARLKEDEDAIDTKKKKGKKKKGKK